MRGKSNYNGRAYEYIFLMTLYDAIKEVRPVTVLKNSSYKAAKKAWNKIPKQHQLYTLSAKSAISTLFALEPNIVEKTNDNLQLYIQPDSRGEEADVRDIILKRKDIVWEIGLSIKHNHMAVKHSRLSKQLDFGDKWYQIPCSTEYWADIKPIFDSLEEYKKNKVYFHDLSSKEDDIYVPLLKAFIKEVKKQIATSPTVPRKMVEYLLSRYDFYKVVSIDRLRLTTIQSFNMYGTLNRASRTKKPALSIQLTDLPTTLLHIDFKPDSKTTVLMCFDNGWQFSFRLHNARSLVETSLKFDIQIVGIPSIVNMMFNCKWDNV